MPTESVPRYAALIWPEKGSANSVKPLVGPELSVLVPGLEHMASTKSFAFEVVAVVPLLHTAPAVVVLVAVLSTDESGALTTA